MKNELGKIPPQALDIEEAVLGAILTEGKTITKVIEFLHSNMFYKECNQKIYECMEELYHSNSPIDSLTVTSTAKKNKTLTIIGGSYYIMELSTKSSSFANIEYHARIIQEKFLKREGIRIGSELVSKSFDESIDVFDSFHEAEIDISKASNVKDRDKDKDTKAVIDEFYDIINNLTTKSKPIKTGLREFDIFNGGLNKSDLVVIAGQTSNGKTALAINMLLNAANNGHKCKFYSFEMSETQLFTRQISIISGQNGKDIMNGNQDLDYPKINSAVSQMEQHRTVYNNSCRKIEDMVKDIEKGVEKEDIECVFIDYIQLMESRKEKRAESVGYIANTLKALAVRLNIPIVLLSQMTKDAAGRPSVTALKESGDIANAADTILLVWSPAISPSNMEEVQYKGKVEQTDLPNKRLLLVYQDKGRNTGCTSYKFFMNDSMKIFSEDAFSYEFHTTSADSRIEPSLSFQNNTDAF